MDIAEQEGDTGAVFSRLATPLAIGALLWASPAAAAEDPPTLAPLIDELSRAITNCGIVSCAVRDLVAGRETDLVVPLRRKPNRAAVNAERGAYVVVQGEHRGRTARLAATAFAGDPGRLTVHMDGRLAPDHYRGAAVVRPSSEADQVVVPFTLDVRAGPELALFVLLGSVFAGWLIGKIFGLAPKREFSAAAEALRVRINALPTSEKALLTPLFDEAWALRGEELALAQKRTDSLDAAVRALRRAREIQDPVFNDPGNLPFVPWLQRIGGATAALHTSIGSYASAFDEEVAAIRAQVEALRTARAAETEVAELSARAEAARGQLANAAFAKAVKDVRTAIAGVSPNPSEPATQLGPLLATVRQAFKALEQAHGPLPLPEAVPGAVAPSGVGDAAVAVVGALGWPIGGAATEAAAAFDVVASIARVALPFASWVVAVVLLALGFKLTYLDKATFGATAGDWLALVIWGLAAWGARQTLTGLGPPATKE